MGDTYTAIGPERGSCGHAHRSLGAARLCCRRDHTACARKGLVSDRQVFVQSEKDRIAGRFDLVDLGNDRRAEVATPGWTRPRPRGQ